MMNAVLAFADRFGAVALAVWLVVLAAIAFPTWHPDMAGLYMGGRFFALGQLDLIYPLSFPMVAETPQEWLPELTALGHTSDVAFPFVYPPIWGAFIAPPTMLLSVGAFMKIALCVQVGLLFLSARLAHQIAGGFISSGRWAAATVLVRVLLVVALIATGRWRALGAMLATIGALVALSFLVCGTELNARFIDASARLAQSTVSARITYNLSPILMALSPTDPDIIREIGMGGYVAVTPAWTRLLTSILVVVGTVLLVIATRKRHPDTKIVALVTGLSLIIALLGPFGWVHYFLLSTLMLPVLLDPRFPRMARALFCVGLVVPSAQLALLAPLFVAQLLPFAYFLGVLVFFAVMYVRTPSPSDLKESHARPQPSRP